MKKVLVVLCMALLAGGMVFTSCTKKFTITVTSNNDAWGTVTGGGMYDQNAEVTLKAVPAEGYVFEKWNDGVTESVRVITVVGNANYVANFKKAEDPTPQPQPDPVPPTVPTPSGNGVAVTFGTSTWQGAETYATHYDDYGAWQVYTSKTTSEEFPNLDIIAYADAVGNYTDATTDGRNYGDVLNALEYYETTYLVDGNNNYYGDWWAKSATINVTAFDATALTMTANVSAVMFSAAEAFVGQDAVGFALASKTGMSVGMVGVEMEEYEESGKAAPMKKRTASKLFRVK